MIIDWASLAGNGALVFTDGVISMPIHIDPKDLGTVADIAAPVFQSLQDQNSVSSKERSAVEGTLRKW